jgi:hypothetical protein
LGTILLKETSLHYIWNVLNVIYESHNIIKKTSSNKNTETWFELGHTNCTIKSLLVQSCSSTLGKASGINLLVIWSNLLFFEE